MIHLQHITRWLTLLALVASLLPNGLVISAKADDLPIASSVTNVHPLNRREQLLANAVHALQQGKLDAALQSIETLLRLQPNFRLAQLMQGDLLLAHAQALDTFGNTSSNSPARNIQLNDLRAEARARLDTILQPPPINSVPDNVLQLADDVRQVLLVDTSTSRLYLFENQNGLPHYLADFYVSIGKNGAIKQREGDDRTPLGIYRITGRLHSHALTAIYGPEAFPLNFPNDWDERLHKSGHGIWLHGTFTGTFSRPPHASDGCVVLNNNDLETLSAKLSPQNTIVVITDHINWISPETAIERRTQFAQQISDWQHDWESLNINHYASHYADDFTAGDKPYSRWLAEKRQINNGKRWIQVKFEHMSLYAYPGQKNLYLADFMQDYSSNNLSDVTHKHLYWTQHDEQWKIVAEYVTKTKD